ncbi:OB-fold domain-containing protein, partial [Myxococcota bacterium]|nr:OB-fold domain-containing protein [Myxococcota bacterium]
EGRLVIQRGGACGTLRHDPQPMCPPCRSLGFAWAPVSGRGRIYSSTIAHRAFHPASQAHVPYAIGTIELDEGSRMACDLLATPPEAVAIDAPVEAYLEELPGQGSMPRFRLAGDAGRSSGGAR